MLLLVALATSSLERRCRPDDEQQCAAVSSSNPLTNSCASPVRRNARKNKGCHFAASYSQIDSEELYLKGILLVPMYRG
ncbi:unnamed protein product [Musa acuminata subsp. malaccensis]|uniref:(wild Malaysian banana) hypothetical protein n=1 Tax=Musa acuminata subsp. malaccensis TaxID=214687 RepID=A0A804IAB4_MUSAM|nr:unnamed protein product [Musa acuminata subsp. malaccensis]